MISTRFISTILCWFICQLCFSQELKIRNFSLVQNDITARSKQRFDSNNDPCALVRVSTMGKEVDFSGNLVGDVIKENNEYLVYMTEGSKNLKITGKGVLPLNINFAEHGIPQLIGKNVYQIFIVVIYDNNELSYSADKVFTIKGVTLKMKYVEGGTFYMGATKEQGTWSTDLDEYPIHEVSLNNFMIAETEVTQALWKAVMGSNPSHYKGDEKPVETVSWHDCKLFLERLNSITGEKFRLPTEAEWEYAARGGQLTQGFRYPGSENPKSTCWYGNSNNGTHEVAKKCPNELGLYDIGGNVWEWCEDWKDKYTSEPVANPKGPKTGIKKVLRGGSINSTKDLMRTTHRSSNTPDYKKSYIGLRIAL